MQVHKGGEKYGFCPAKATWDPILSIHFRQLVLMCEIKVLPLAGGLHDQDAEIIESLAWFMPKYEIMKFIAKVDMILGNDDIMGKATKVVNNKGGRQGAKK